MLALLRHTCSLTKRNWWEARRGNREAKEKGCDFGYALADNSCEGALSVDACTVTALDVITAFAVPNPG